MRRGRPGTGHGDRVCWRLRPSRTRALLGARTLGGLGPRGAGLVCWGRRAAAESRIAWCAARGAVVGRGPRDSGQVSHASRRLLAARSGRAQCRPAAAGPGPQRAGGGRARPRPAGRSSSLLGTRVPAPGQGVLPRAVQGCSRDPCWLPGHLVLLAAVEGAGRE